MLLQGSSTKRALIPFLIVFLCLLIISCVNPEDKYVEGNIKITEKEFAETLGNLPADVAENILAKRAVFLSYIEKLINISRQDENFILFPVDKTRFLPETFRPSDLVDLEREGVSVARRGLLLRANAAAALLEMHRAASSEGILLSAASAFRTFEHQRNIHNNFIRTHGQEATERFSAPPGASQHQLGTAVDFFPIAVEFKDTRAGRWIKENGWRYGFSLSYPYNFEEITGYMYEPWHYRYITKEGALVEREFFGGLQFLFLNYLAEHKGFFKERLAVE
ncbi:MAG: M15 family metallopeptidase [Spirochaetaceae bacterium]|nr:M15 family metallopeptidase [Spirochaetaceae bacterium]